MIMNINTALFTYVQDILRNPGHLGHRILLILLCHFNCSNFSFELESTFFFHKAASL